MSQTSHLSRYQPAVLVITGAAAAAGIYVLYSIYADAPTKSALHRSNAMHRPRGPRQARVAIEFTHPTTDAPLGVLVVVRDHVNFMSNLATQGVLSAREIFRHFELPDDIDPLLQWKLNVASVQSVLRACTQVGSLAVERQIASLGLAGLDGAVVAGDVERIREFGPAITTVLPGVNAEHIDQAITRIVENSESLRRPNVSSSDSDALTYAETEAVDGLDGASAEQSQGLKGLLYHIAEADAKRKAYEHRGIHCEECGERNIRGVRWHCLNCADFDLCSTCEANTDHPKTHVFSKIKMPLPVLSQPTKVYPLWYPGDPRKIHPALKPALKKRLQEEYSFEGPQMDANYDQFTCIANVPWPNDPNEIKGAIDRRAFNKALTSERWPQRFRPNAIYDRMFAFYDTNQDGLIGFEEFVSGLAYLRGPKRFTPLRRALQGFDIDEDGFVDRNDFIRLFRAKHEIQKLIINDMIEGHETEITRAAMETLRSGQPISSVFSMEEVPQGEDRPRNGKAMDSYGDMQPLPGTKTILEDDEGWDDERNGLQRRRDRGSAQRLPHEQVQNHLSRSEEIANSPTDGTDEHRGRVEDEESNASQQQSHRVSERSTSEDKDQEDLESSTDSEDEVDEPLNQDILWQIVEDGFHEMLDPLFKEKERQDQEVVDTREERQRWHDEIVEVAKQRKEREALQDELSKGALIDPLVATAATSFAATTLIGPPDAQLSNGQSSTDFRIQNMLPTDPEGLARLEAEIAQRPLDELLKETGYSRVDVEDRDNDSLPPHGTASVEPNGTLVGHEASAQLPVERHEFIPDSHSSTHSVISSSDLSQDPTMPQNRPNALPTPKPADGDMKSSSKSASEPMISQDSVSEVKVLPPSRERLDYLALLDERDREFDISGEPGRLSYNLVENLVKADSSKELRGLVVSWLEWASF